MFSSRWWGWFHNIILEEDHVGLNCYGSYAYVRAYGAALAPASKVRLPMDVGARRVALAQRVSHQVGQGLAPDGVPLCLSDGFKAYRTAGRTP